MVLTLILLVLAFACFILAAIGVTSPRVALLPLGLALLVAMQFSQLVWR